jgi:hypothetical protein
MDFQYSNPTSSHARTSLPRYRHLHHQPNRCRVGSAAWCTVAITCKLTDDSCFLAPGRRRVSIGLR